MKLFKYFFVLVLLTLNGLFPALAKAAVQSHTPQEKWVLKQVEAGENADLKARFGEKEENRQLSARFLEDLLTVAFKVHRRGIRIFHAVINEPLDLENAEVLHSVFFVSCIFKKDLNFRDSRFARHLLLSFCQLHQKANFHRVKVVLNLLCKKTVFFGPVDFRFADIGGQFIAQEAQFLHDKEKAKFSDIKVGDSAFIDKAIFKGPANFGGANIGGQYSAREAHFLHEKEAAIFNGMKVGLDAFINKAIFKGSVDFSGADIGRQFAAMESQFLHEKEAANFNAMKVGQSAFFDRTIFKGPVVFGTADIGQQFNTKEAQFLNKKETANFNGMKVQGAFFDLATFKGPVDFRYSSFDFLQFSKVICSQVKLEGMTYKNIIIGANWRDLLKLLEKSPFHSQPYNQLETFFKQSGYVDRADEVYISGKQRELKESRDWSKPWHWPEKILEKIFLDVGVGYGRHPGRVLYFSGFFVFLGTIIFSRPGVLTELEAKNTERIKLKQAFWYSLDAYLPFISLGPDKFYQLDHEAKLNWSILIHPSIVAFLPKWIRNWLYNHYFSAATYFYLHQLAGYILVSIGIAAVTGIIK